MMPYTIIYAMCGGYAFASDKDPEMVDFIFHNKNDALAAARDFQINRRADPDHIIDLAHLHGRDLRQALRALDDSPSPFHQ